MIFDYTNKYKKIEPKELKSWINNNEKFSLVDVRMPEEYLNGHIPGAMLLTDKSIKVAGKNLLPDKNAKIVVYCLTGKRSRLSAKELIRLGYTNVFDLGGILMWPFEITK